MSANVSPNAHSPTYALAKRFMVAFTALRSHVATQSIINYPPGLSPNQLKMLHLIFHIPGISQTAAAERLSVTTAAISASVRELENQGLIERLTDPQDARVLLLHLAPFGEQIFEQVFDTFITTFANLLDALPQEDQGQLVDRLEQALTANNIPLDNRKLSYADKLRMMKKDPNPADCAFRHSAKLNE